MADAARAEEDSIEEVLIDRVTVAEGLAGMKEEGDVNTSFSALFTKVEEQGREIGERAAKVFLSDEVVACDHFREFALHLYALVHTCLGVLVVEGRGRGGARLTIYNSAVVEGTYGGPDHAYAPKVLALF